MLLTINRSNGGQNVLERLRVATTQFLVGDTGDALRASVLFSKKKELAGIRQCSSWNQMEHPGIF